MKRTRRLEITWVAVCAATLVLALGSRVLRYLPLPLGSRGDEWLGRALGFQFVQAFNAVELLGAHMVLVVVLVAALAVAKRWPLRRRGGRLWLASWLSALVWFELAVFNTALDLDPWLALLALATAPSG